MREYLATPLALAIIGAAVLALLVILGAIVTLGGVR